jgi:hypothetical protein
MSRSLLLAITGIGMGSLAVLGCKFGPYLPLSTWALIAILFLCAVGFLAVVSYLRLNVFENQPDPPRYTEALSMPQPGTIPGGASPFLYSISFFVYLNLN